MNDFKYVLINMIAFLALSCGSVIYGSNPQDQSLVDLENLLHSPEFRAAVTEIVRTERAQADLFERARQTREIACAARESERRQSAPLAEQIANLAADGIALADQVNGVRLTQAQIDRRAFERNQLDHPRD